MTLVLNMGVCPNLWAEEARLQPRIDQNMAYEYLKGSWSFKLEQCKRPFWTFEPKMLLEKTDADGVPVQYSFPIKEYLSKPDEILVKFEKGQNLTDYVFESDTMKFRKVNEATVEFYNPKPASSPSWVTLHRCPSKPNGQPKK